jgi:hypothetical protein
MAYATSRARESGGLISEYHIPDSCVYQLTSLNMFIGKCSAAFKRGTPYLAFRCVLPDMLEQIDAYREKHLRSSRVLYDEEAELLIVKLMPGVLHGHATASFSQELLEQLHSMGLGGALKGLGDARFGTRGGRQKEPACSYKPSTRVGRDSWPSLVIEVGVSQTLSQLQCDAWFWLTKSAGMTWVVFLIKIDDDEKSIII